MVTKKKTTADGFNFIFLTGLCDNDDIVLIQGDNNLALGIQSLADLETKTTRNIG